MPAAGRRINTPCRRAVPVAFVMPLGTRRPPLSLLVFAMLVAMAAESSTAAAADLQPETSPGFFSCKRDYRDFADRARSRASADLYNGFLYFGATAGLHYGGDPSRRWSSTNGFDTGIRSELRLGSAGARDDADLASDLTLVFAAALLPVSGIGAKFARTHDCVETWDMFTDTFESLSMTLFVTEAVKLAAGRSRPSTRECDGSPPADASCGSNDRHLSFFSGHASLAAAGAGLTCSYAISREAWGTSLRAKAAPCALGVAAALTTGVLRMAADKHWASDVLMSFTVGAAIGYFDLWGPFDLLKFRTHDSGGRISSQGIVLPRLGDGSFGTQIIVVF